VRDVEENLEGSKADREDLGKMHGIGSGIRDDAAFWIPVPVGGD